MSSGLGRRLKCLFVDSGRVEQQLDGSYYLELVGTGAGTPGTRRYWIWIWIWIWYYGELLKGKACMRSDASSDLNMNGVDGVGLEHDCTGLGRTLVVLLVVVVGVMMAKRRCCW